MKKNEQLKNYRLKYKKYYNIDFDNNYDIHHIDFNHNNNDISNLILLPKALHRKYHLCLSELGCPDGNLKYNAKINIHIEDGRYDLLIILGETLAEIAKWKNYKMQLDLQIQNTLNCGGF